MILWLVCDVYQRKDKLSVQLNALILIGSYFIWNTRFYIYWNVFKIVFRYSCKVDVIQIWLNSDLVVKV
jgi:hypothetical protein